MTISLVKPPKTSDGRQIIQSSRFRGDVDPYICGVGDHRTNGKGQGTPMDTGWVTQATPDDNDVSWVFNDWVYVSSGGIEWKCGERGDWIDMWVSAPGSAYTANGGGTGNANENDVGGGALLFTPAAGDGDTDLDLASHDVVPVPSYDAEGNPKGWWDWDNADTGAGTISANAEQKGAYDLYSFEIKLVHWVCRMPLLGTGATGLDPQTKARKMLPHWVFHVKVHNSGHDNFDVVWWLNTARKKTT